MRAAGLVQVFTLAGLVGCSYDWKYHRPASPDAAAAEGGQGGSAGSSGGGSGGTSGARAPEGGSAGKAMPRADAGCDPKRMSCDDEDAGVDAGMDSGVDSGPPHCANEGECTDHLACNGSEQCTPGSASANDFGCVPGTAPSCPSGQACSEAVGGCACGAVASCRQGARCDATRDACFGDAPAWPMPTAVRNGLPESRNYQDQADVIADLVTGLSWQKKDGGRKNTWDDALAYCATLDLGSKTDWRLPTLQEFASLVGPTSSGATTFAFSYYFEFTETGREAWTATETHGQTGLVWSVGTSSLSYAQSKTGGLALPARCVRGSGARSPNATRFSTSGNSVTDSATGLVWTRNAPNVILGNYAASACADLDQDGSSDWRLPEVDELMSLYDPALGSFIAQPFPDLAQPASGFVWAETGGALGPDGRLSIDFLDWAAAASGDDGIRFCVR